MQGQRPSLSSVLNPSSSNSKPSSSKTNPLHPLPQTQQQPTPSNPIQFYKTRQRLTSQMFSTRIGYRIRQYSRVEQDYIIYLTQLISMECQGIKIYVIEPNYLYFEVGMVGEERQEMNQDKEKERQEIELSNGMFGFLKDVSEDIFNPWVDVNLDARMLTNEDFSEQKVIESFTKQVVEKIKQKHQEVFEKRKTKRNE